MELKEAVLFAIYERTRMKGRHCTVNNIMKNLEVYKQFKAKGKNDLRNEVIATIYQLMDEQAIESIINDKAKKKEDMVCVCIPEDNVEEVRQEYRANAKARYDALTPAAAQVLQSIYTKHEIMREPYIIRDMTPAKQDIFWQHADQLHDCGFVGIRDTYNKDGEILNCQNAVISISAKIACDMSRNAESQQNRE